MTLAAAPMTQTLTVYSQETGEDSGGRFTESDPTPGVRVSGVLSLLAPDQQAQYQQASHNVTHSLITTGKPYAQVKPGDLLKLGTRVFYVELIEDMASMGRFTVYRLRETPGGA